MVTQPQSASALRIAVIGAGPAGLALALLAARQLPWADITLFDARSADHDVRRDARTIALSLGSVQLLESLNAWDEQAAQGIAQVHVSQAPPTWGNAAVRISADELGLPMLGAVLPYGPLVAQLQQAWEAAVAQDEARGEQAAHLHASLQAHPQPHPHPHPQTRLHSRWGSPVRGLKALDGPAGVEVDAGIAERFDLAVVAEGGVFADQVRKSLRHDYAQTAWVGSVTLEGAAPGVAFERFTRQGPVALLPLPGAPGAVPLHADGAQPFAATRAALVWCVNQADDPVRGLNDAQRMAVLQSLLPPEAGRVTGISALKHFPLGLNAERTLVQGRQVRIGNAAQTLHPVAGQGLNLGLRDAHALVQALRFLPLGAAGAVAQTEAAQLAEQSTPSAQPTQSTPSARSAQPAAATAAGPRAVDVDAALRSVEWQRAPDRWSTIASTDFLARSFTWAWPGVAAARGLGLAALQAAAPLRRALARQMMFGRR